MGRRPNIKRLYRSNTDKKMAGVGGGLGEYTNIDSMVIRLLWVVITVMTGVLPGIIAYIVAAIMLPVKED